MYTVPNICFAYLYGNVADSLNHWGGSKLIMLVGMKNILCLLFAV